MFAALAILIGAAVVGRYAAKVIDLLTRDEE